MWSSPKEFLVGWEFIFVSSVQEKSPLGSAQNTTNSRDPTAHFRYCIYVEEMRKKHALRRAGRLVT